ncbi:MAG: hypothetical protein ABIB43_02595 [archaeon]
MTSIIKPNKSKIFFLISVNALLVLVLAILLLTIIQFITDMGVLYQWRILLMTLVVAVVIVIKYFSIKGLKYVFGETNLTIKKYFFIFFKTTKTVSYSNIAKVTIHDKGWLNSILNTGSIIIDVSRMGEKELKLKYIDNPKNFLKTIEEILRSFHVKTQTSYVEQYKIKKALDKDGL